MAYFEQVKNMVQDLGYEPENENLAEELFTISDEENGINSLVIDCEDPILVLEMVVMPFSERMEAVKLLQMNRGMVHGAFALDESAGKVIWRDTLQLENLDYNELEGTINALTLCLAEFSGELLKLNQQ